MKKKPTIKSQATEPAPKRIEPDLSAPERAALFGVLNQRPLGRRALPIMAALRDGTAVTLSQDEAEAIKAICTAALDGPGVAGGVLEVASIERKLTEALEG